MQVKISPINAKNPRITTIEVISGDKFILASYRQITGKLKYLIPVIGKDIGLANAFSATGLLIIVSVALEFNKALESQIMMRHYKGFLK